METAHEYLAAILRRARDQMEPRDFHPDWSDRPRKTKFYPDVEYCEPPYSDLPYRGERPGSAGTVDRWLTPADDGPGFTLRSLSDMLLDSYGQHARRLAIHANSDVDSLPYYPGATWARGTASGGGLYPVSVYWVSGASGPVVPGVYFYSTNQRAFQRLLTGDVSPVVRDAVGDSTGTDQFLVLGVKFWQNAFKYNSFSYHAVTMDVGTVLQTWRMWAGAHGLTLAPVLWFDDERISSLLGVEQDAEAMMAVVPLRWSDDDRPDAPPADPPRPVTTAPAPRVRYTDRERSRRVSRFDFPLAVDRASRRTTSDRPQWIDLAGALPVPPRPDAVRVPLPERLPLDVSMRHALPRRRSSFGRFAAAPAMTAAQLSSLLAGVNAAARFECDLGGSSPLAKFYVFANHVTGVAPGAYEFDPATNELCLASPGAHGGFLQRNYFLDNYNVEQAGAVIVPTVRAAAVLDAVGARGYRLVNAVVGAVAQAAYTVAAAVDLGCGVALGFDNISYIDELSLEETGDVPLLIMMIGRERALAADYRFELV